MANGCDGGDFALEAERDGSVDAVAADRCCCDVVMAFIPVCQRQRLIVVAAFSATQTQRSSFPPDIQMGRRGIVELGFMESGVPIARSRN